jgi:hypothetical protein
VREKIDIAIDSNMKILVGEARGASRLYQDYLYSKCYRNVVVGHAKSIRYNAGNWKTVQFGQNLKDRERNMIENCDSALIIWNDNSSVIANNLELLKKSGKLTFIYEYDSKNKQGKFSMLDPTRVYGSNYRYRRILEKKSS